MRMTLSDEFRDEIAWRLIAAANIHTLFGETVTGRKYRCAAESVMLGEIDSETITILKQRFDYAVDSEERHFWLRAMDKP